MPQPTDEQVASVPLFQRMSPEDRALVAMVAEVRHYATNDIVFAEGAPSDVMLMILTGRVRILGKHAGAADEIPDVIVAGDPQGDIAAYEGGPYPGTGVAMEPTECLAIPRVEFFRLLETPTFVRTLVLSLTHRIVELATELRRRGPARKS